MDDVPELFLPMPSRPPGPRPPYRGLSITIPADVDIDAGGDGGGPAPICSPGLTIRIWKVRAVRPVSALSVFAASDLMRPTCLCVSLAHACPRACAGYEIEWDQHGGLSSVARTAPFELGLLPA